MSVQGELAPDTGRFAVMRLEWKSSQPFAAQGQPRNQRHGWTGVTVPKTPDSETRCEAIRHQCCENRNQVTDARGRR